MDEKKLDIMFTNIELMSKNQVIDFIIRMNSLDLNLVKDRMLLLNYAELANNNLKICNNINAIELKKEVKRIKNLIISRMNEIFNESLNI